MKGQPRSLSEPAPPTAELIDFTEPTTGSISSQLDLPLQHNSINYNNHYFYPINLHKCFI